MLGFFWVIFQFKHITLNLAPMLPSPNPISQPSPSLRPRSAAPFVHSRRRQHAHCSLSLAPVATIVSLCRDSLAPALVAYIDAVLGLRFLSYVLCFLCWYLGLLLWTLGLDGRLFSRLVLLELGLDFASDSLLFWD